MSKRILLTIAFFSVILVFSSTFLLLKKNVGGFDFLSVGQSNCTPYNIFTKKGEAEYSMQISWETKGKCLGFVQYGLDRNNLDRVGIDISEDRGMRKHIVTLDKLTTKQKYYFLINSDNQAYGNNSSPLEFILENL